MTTAARYAELAAREARGVSATYERLSLAVYRDEELLALIDTLPAFKRQPNLLFGVVRFLGGPVEDPVAFHDYPVANCQRSSPSCAGRTCTTGATLVVFHISLLHQVPPGHWIAIEAPHVVTYKGG